MNQPKTPADEWTDACIDAASIADDPDFENQGLFAIMHAESLRRLAHRLKGWACVQCGEPVEERRRLSAYAAPTCFACLPPPGALPPVRTHWPWDVDIDTTRVALERCMRALVVTGTLLTDRMLLGGRGLGRGVSALLRVQIPVGQHDQFEEACQPIRMRPPPRLQVGTRTPPDDGHPGRTRCEN